MSPYIFLKTYHRLQKGLYIDEVIDLGFAEITYAQKDPSLFSNTAFTNNLLSAAQLKEIEKKLISLNRTPAIYFENTDRNKVLQQFLLNNHYNKSYEDSWLFHSGENIDTKNFSIIKKVTTENELEIFLDTFDKCFEDDDPQNPYGNVKSFLEPTKNAWHKYKNTKRFQSFIAYKENDPVAVGSISTFEDIGYILNIGSLKKVRGEGFGKLITQYCVYISCQNNNRYHCLATEDGTYPNEFYKRIGFKTKFTAVCYVKA